MYYEHDWKEEYTPAPKEAKATWPPVNPDLWPDFMQYFKWRGLNAELARLNGWYPSSRAGDRWPRVVIPCERLDNEVYWQARAMFKFVEIRYQSPKIRREDAIVVVNEVDRSTKVVVIAEGPFDALAAGEVSGVVGIGLMGNAPPDLVLNHALSIVTKFDGFVLLIPDRDNIAAFAPLLPLFAAYQVRLVPLIEYGDLAEIPYIKRAKLIYG
jgi:hypothetical protein